MERTKSRLLITKNRFICAIICIVMTIFLIAINQDGRLNQYLSIAVLLFSVLAVCKSRKNWNLLIIEITILFCNYSIVGPNYLFHLNTSFTEFATDSAGILGLDILLLFSTLNYIFAPVIIKRNYEEPIIIEGRYNPIIILGFIAILSLIWVYGFRRPTSVGGRGSPTAIYEYSIVFIIIAYYYCGNRLWAKIAVTIAAFMFALQNFVFGGRITGVQLILCVVICLFIDKITLNKVAVVSVIGLPIMTGIGSARGSYLLNISSFENAIHNMLAQRLTLDTAYSAYFTSLTFLKVKGNIPFEERMYLFRQFLLSLILGGSVKDSSLPDITRPYFLHYWGGVIPYYAYFYLGIIGVVLISIYIGFLKKQIRDKEMKSDFIRIMSIYIVATTFRWYLYAPTQLFRGILLLGIVYYATRLFHSLFERNTILQQ